MPRGKLPRFFSVLLFVYSLQHQKGWYYRIASAQWSLKDCIVKPGEKKFKNLTESSKVSKFSKKEFEAYQKMFHEKWDHNVLKDSFFEEFADEINAKVAEGVLDKTREMAKGLRDDKVPMEIIIRRTGLSEEEIRKL